MAFLIAFTSDPHEYVGDDDTPSAVGRIVAGELDETFLSTLYEWNKEDYESQWARALEGFLLGDKKAVLITSYVNPRESSNLEWWALYRGDAENVYVQNHFLFYDQLDREFSVADANNFLHDRITVRDEPLPSEWEISLSDIEFFFRQLKGFGSK